MPCHHNVLESEDQHFVDQSLHNKPAPNVSFYTPNQDVPAGTAESPAPPKLFQSLTLREVTLQNRIMVRSPTKDPFNTR